MNDVIFTGKAEELEASFHEAWRIISNSKVFHNNNSCDEKITFLESIGVYDADDLKDLEDNHISVLAGYMKEIPRKKWLRLLISGRPN